MAVVDTWSSLKSSILVSAELERNHVDVIRDERLSCTMVFVYPAAMEMYLMSLVLNSHLSVPGPKIRTPLQGCEVTEGEDALFSIDLSVMVTGTWFLNSTQLQDSQHYSIQQAKTQHSLVIHSTKVEDHEAEVTFIANGVRDSAVLKVQGRCWRTVECKEK